MRIGIATSGRQDWDIVRSTCAALRAAGADFVILAGGTHMSTAHGMTRDLITADGFHDYATVEWDVGASPEDAMAEALRVMSRALEQHRVQSILLTGDRFETMAFACAATLARIPLVHLHGGEETEGAFDNAFRHAITKLSHLHLVSHTDHARRVVEMGEEPSSVHVVGAPGLDNLFRTDLATRAELEKDLGLSLVDPVVVVTVHPATLRSDAVETDVLAVCDAMDAVHATYVVTLPNVDPGAPEIRRRLEHAATRDGRVATTALGSRRYWGLLRVAAAMIGNSSSGLIEAPAVRLPVVNVGPRQAGRLRFPNVIDASSTEEVRTALLRAIDPHFREALPAEMIPLADGAAGTRVAKLLLRWSPEIPPLKRHHRRAS